MKSLSRKFLDRINENVIQFRKKDPESDEKQLMKDVSKKVIDKAFDFFANDAECVNILKQIEDPDERKETALRIFSTVGKDTAKPILKNILNRTVNDEIIQNYAKKVFLKVKEALKNE